MTLGPVATLAAPALVGGILATLIVGVNGWNRYRRSRQSTSPDERGLLEGCPRYRRYLQAAVAAGGSARDWDHNVRAVLADLAETVFAGDRPGADPESARAVLGDDMWGLIDSERAQCDDHNQPGPGAESLLDILARLESTAIDPR
jgi:hypothetical protein